METYSFIGRPGMGSKIPVPFSCSSSARSWSESRTDTCEPNSERNMLPFTNAARLPNIGRTLTRGSSGTRDSKYALDASSGFGSFMLTPALSLGLEGRDPQGGRCTRRYQLDASLNHAWVRPKVKESPQLGSVPRRHVRRGGRVPVRPTRLQQRSRVQPDRGLGRRGDPGRRPPEPPDGPRAVGPVRRRSGPVRGGGRPRVQLCPILPPAAAVSFGRRCSLPGGVSRPGGRASHPDPAQKSG